MTGEELDLFLQVYHELRGFTCRALAIIMCQLEHKIYKSLQIGRLKDIDGRRCCLLEPSRAHIIHARKEEFYPIHPNTNLIQ